MERMSQVNATSNDLTYWCHTCKTKVQVNRTQNHEISCKYPIVGTNFNEAIVGCQCNGWFCEMLESDYDEVDSPMHFEPFVYEPDNNIENSLEELSLNNNVSKQN